MGPAASAIRFFRAVCPGLFLFFITDSMESARETPSFYLQYVLFFVFRRNTELGGGAFYTITAFSLGDLYG